MTWSGIPLALAIAALAAYVVLVLLEGRRPGSPAARTGVLAGLALVACVAHVRLVDRDASGTLGLRVPHPHVREFLAYYVGTKYFPELGYTGLYEAAVVADFEDDRAHFRPQGLVRDLASYRLVRRGSVVADAARIEARFSPERWQQFKADVALLRDATRPEYWNESGFYVDHGYNATPLVTALLGGLAQQPWLEPASFFDLVRWADLYGVLLVGVVVAGLEGAVAGLTLLFFTFANPLNDFGFVGAAYLRYGYWLALGLAFAALRARWRVSAGVLFAVSGWLRIFPLVFPALLLLCDLLGPRPLSRVRARGRLHGAFALASLAILAATSLVPTPDGRNPWVAFGANMRLHAGTFGANQIGLQVPFRYSPEKDGVGQAARPDWRRETGRVLRERRFGYWAAAALLVAFALWALRRGGDGSVLLAGLLIIYACVPLAHYYYAVLGLVPLAVGWCRHVRLWLALTLLAASLTALPLWLTETQDLRYSIFSLEIGAFLLIALVRVARRRPGVRAKAACATLLVASLAACSSGERSGAELVDGDAWHSNAFGLTLRKPPDWTFVPGPSLLVDPPERVEDEARAWEILDKPALTPLVRVVRHPEPYDGINPSFSAHVIPPRPGDADWAFQKLVKAGPVNILNANVGIRRKWPGYEELEPVGPFSISGLEGATIRMTYRPEDDGPAGQALEVRRWHVRRGRLFFYFEAIGPRPLPPELDRDFDWMIASVRLDP